MDQFKQLTTFVAVANKGSLTAAAVIEGIAPAMVGRRLDALEERLGVRLLLRTTRKLSLTPEGASFLEDCLRILSELESAQAAVSAGSLKAKGHLIVTAPAGFGRAYIAPLAAGFQAQHPDIHITLDLSDRVVDLVNEQVDCAVRIGELQDSRLIAVRLADNERVVVGSPAYLQRAGIPKNPSELSRHNCLAFSAGGSQRGWLLRNPKNLETIKVSGSMQSSDGSVLRDWAMAGQGLAWRSWWEVGSDVQAGQLQTVLDTYAAPHNGVFLVYPERKHMPPRLRLWQHYLKNHFAKLKLTRR